MNAGLSAVRLHGVSSYWRTALRARPAASFVFALLSALANAQTTPSDALDRLHLAINKSDRAAAASVLAADLQIFESGFVERSREEYLSHHFESDARFAGAVTRRVMAHREQTAGTMALVMEETETTGSYQGQPVRLIGTETVVFRLEGGNWQIVHIHWSSRKPKP